MLTGAPLSHAFSQVLKKENRMKATISEGTPMRTSMMTDMFCMGKIRLW